MNQLKRFRGHFYGFLIVTVLISMGVFTNITTRMQNDAAEAYMENSPYFTPWEYFGVWCKSEVQLNGAPFTVNIRHAPGQGRDVIDESATKLTEANSTRPPEPWTQEDLDNYAVMRTMCFNTWRELYDGWGGTQKQQMTALLPTSPTEADHHHAILSVAFPENLAEAKAIFPVTAEIIGPSPQERKRR